MVDGHACNGRRAARSVGDPARLKVLAPKCLLALNPAAALLQAKTATGAHVWLPGAACDSAARARTLLCIVRRPLQALAEAAARSQYCRAAVQHAPVQSRALTRVFHTHTHTTHTRLQAQAEEAAYTLADELANIARRVSQIDGTLKLKDREIARLRKQVCACSMQCVFVLCAVSVCAGCRVECDECGCIVVCGQILCICPLASGAREVHSACTCLQSQPQSWQGAACTFGCLSAQTRLVMHS